MIKVKRIYEPAADSDGARFLVDRLWARGVKKEHARLAGWIKDVAPSNGLRNWYGHAPEKWEEFQRRYSAELDSNPGTWEPLVEAAKAGDITLLFSSRELERNNAVALKSYLLRKASRSKKPARARSAR